MKFDMKQKTFNLRTKQEITFSTYIKPANASNSLHPIYNFLATKDFEKIFYLWGGTGTGKSHLLQSASSYMNKLGQKSMYISFKHPAVINPEIFESLEHFELICLDDIDQILNAPSWQEAIYYCLELTESHNIKIMVSGQNNINETSVIRPESYSRLAASYRHQLSPLSEIELFEAFKLRAKQRQIPISEDTFRYIKNHAPRDSKSVFRLLDIISDESLRYQKIISKKMVREILVKYFNILDQTETSR